MIMTDHSKVTIEKFTSYIHSKKDLYDAAIRNGYYLPSFTSSAISEDYIMKIVKGELWCPQFKDIRLLPCVKPPPKDVLITKLEDFLLKIHKHGGFQENKQPNKEWIINVLATYCPKDEIFDKNYLPPSRPDSSRIIKYIDLPLSFLKGLPISNRKRKRQYQTCQELERWKLRCLN